MYSISTSNLKLTYYPSFEYFSSKRAPPLFVVLNTLEFHDNDVCRIREGFSLLYQAFCRTSEIQLESEVDVRLCHEFVNNFNAMQAHRDHSDPRWSALCDATFKAGLGLVKRLRNGHIIFDPRP